MISVIGFIVGIIAICVLFKYLLGEVTISTLIAGIIVSSASFLGLCSDSTADAIILAAAPTFAIFLTFLILYLADHDKKIF